jgi:hypothetical protein
MKQLAGLHSRDYLLILVFGLICAFVIALNKPLHGDEQHFYRTIVQFGQADISEIIKNYDQVTGPVFFSLYGALGRFVAFDKEILRFINLISFVIFLLVYRSCSKAILANKAESFQALLFSLINPYMVGVAIYLYTDGINLLAIYIFYYAVLNKKLLLLAPATALALCTRQYSVYALGASALYILATPQYSIKDKVQAAIYMALGTTPFLYLCYLWGGIAPKQGLAHWVSSKSITYHLDCVTTYVSFMAVYALPVVVYKRASVMRMINSSLGIKGLMATFALSFFALAYPSKISESTATSDKINAVGYVHSAMKLIPVENADKFLIWVFFFIGLVLLIATIKEDLKINKSNPAGMNFFMSINILVFMILMPISYQVWEKYLIVILPLFAIRILNEPQSLKSNAH